MRTPPWPKAIGKIPKVQFIDLVQHRYRGPLDDLVFQRRHPYWALATIRLRYVHPPNWARPVCTSGQPCREVPETQLQFLPVLPPGYSVNSRRGFPLKAVIRFPQGVDGVNVMHQRGQLPSLFSLCCLTYAPQRLFHACPALYPVRVALQRISLDQAPSLHALRRWLASLVRSLHRHYGPVRLLRPVHPRLCLSAPLGAPRRL